MGNINLDGSDFDKFLIDFWINEFCKETGHKEEIISQDKKPCKRLKIKCENAKKLLSILNETVFNIDNFYGQNDLIIKISRDTFDEICKDSYTEIEKIINSVIEENNITIFHIDEVILVGGATKMAGVKNFLGRIFGPDKIKSNLNPDEAVAYGAMLDRAKMEESDKINSNLQDIVAYNFGVEVHNHEIDMIIRKYSKIPYTKKRQGLSFNFKKRRTRYNRNCLEKFLSKVVLPTPRTPVFILTEYYYWV